MTEYSLFISVSFICWWDLCLREFDQTNKHPSHKTPRNIECLFKLVTCRKDFCLFACFPSSVFIKRPLYFYVHSLPPFLHCVCAAEPLDGEEYLDIIGIMRNQAGRYECKASNDVATPDVKYVNVVVNCESLHSRHPHCSLPSERMITSIIPGTSKGLLALANAMAEKS